MWFNDQLGIQTSYLRKVLLNLLLPSSRRLICVGPLCYFFRHDVMLVKSTKVDA